MEMVDKMFLAFAHNPREANTIKKIIKIAQNCW